MCSIDSKEYEFDSLLDINQVHIYENQLKVGETSRVRLDESFPTSALDSLVDDVRAQRHSNILLDEAILGLELFVQAFNGYTINAIKPTTSFSLTYLELID